MEKIAVSMKGLSEINVPEMTMEEFRKKQVEWHNQSEGSLTGIDCRICRNKGVLYMLSEDGYETARECECMKQRRTLEAIRKSGMAQLLERCTFDSYLVSAEWQKRAKLQAQRYAETSSGKWLYMSGQSGCGKTHLCTAVCNAMIRNGKSVKYIIWRKLMQELQALRFDSDRYDEKIREIREPDVLYLDDFLKSTGSAIHNELNYAFEVINYRYISGKQTVISSELFLKDIEDLDVATAGRISEKASGFIVQINKEDGRNFRTRK